LASLFAGACGDAAPESEPAEPPVVEPALNVLTSTYPLHYFASRIGGERIEVRFPAPEGTDPGAWSPSAETILAYQEADLVLLNGAEYEGWTATASLPAATMVDTSAELDDQLIVVEDALTHSHGPEGEHSHERIAAVTWLDLELAERQAAAVRDALVRHDSAGADAYAQGFEDLARDLQALDARLEAAAAAASGRTLVGAVPGYEYLARRYGFDIEEAAFDPADPAGDGFWHEVEHAVGHGAEGTVLLPVPIDDGIAERLQAMGLRAIVFDPMGGRPADGDFLSGMNANIDRLEQGLSN
jgi:zinc transport system substrate-binding protein